MAGLKREVVTLMDEWQLAFPDGLSEADVATTVAAKSAVYAADFDETDKATGIASIDLAGRNQVMIRFFGVPADMDTDAAHIFGQRKCKEHKGADGAAQLGGGVDSDWLMSLTLGTGTGVVDETRAGVGVTTARWCDDIAVTASAVPSVPGAELLPASTVADVTQRVKFDATGYERLTLFLPEGANAEVCGL